METAAARETAGKPPRAVVNLSVRRDGTGVVVSIRDDGPGVDWQAIGERARESGLPHATRGDLEAALFSDGISTRRESTVTSGRGVGLSALRDVVQELGGRSAIENAEGGGTVFRFALPEAMLQDDGRRRAGRAGARSRPASCRSRGAHRAGGA